MPQIDRRGEQPRSDLASTTLGALSRGFAIATFLDPHQPDGRVQDWNFTVEKEIMANTVVRPPTSATTAATWKTSCASTTPPRPTSGTPAPGERLPTGEYSNVATRPYDKKVYGSIQQYQKSGWSNFNGVQFELERRFDKGFGYQLFYVLGNTLVAGGNGWNSPVLGLNQFMPGAVPTDIDARNRLLNYQRDINIPKHRVRWNWIVDLPVRQGQAAGAERAGLPE